MFSRSRGELSGTGADETEGTAHGQQNEQIYGENSTNKLLHSRYAPPRQLLYQFHFTEVRVATQALQHSSDSPCHVAGTKSLAR